MKACASAMSNFRRLAILTILERGEMSVNAMADSLAISQSALSLHFVKFRAAKLVRPRRDAQTVDYAIGSPCVSAILTALRETVNASNSIRVPDGGVASQDLLRGTA
ncbi:MAG: transcriptional regulator [Cytophagaceae bacterium]|nr:MAG: transcriptional regulator [Cytophagaceae bacterium]